jgi:arylsulfatase A-like enzyme
MLRGNDRPQLVAKTRRNTAFSDSRLQQLHSMPLRFILAVAAFLAFAHQSSMAERPNVLFIAIDDLNDWVGCLGGHPQAVTPAIDALAARGTLFTNAHCQGPICGPSRASLLSGKYPHTTGIYQQPGGKPMEADSKHFHGQLLPQYFATHGYETLGCGKITHGYSPQLAFQSFGGTFGGSGPKPKQRFHYQLPDVPWTGTQTDWGAFPDQDQQMPDHQVADWAIAQLHGQHEKPFFLAVGMVRPHVPFYVPQKWFDSFPLQSVALPEVRDDDLDDVPEISRRIHEMPKYPTLDFLHADDNKQFRLSVQAYLACTKFVDDQVGRVLRALQQSPYADNTVIVLFSDHGHHLGEKNRICKHSLWEESTRVPLIFAGKGVKNSVSDEPVGLIDIYPTLLQLCDLPERTANEGQSLLPFLQGTNTLWRAAVLTTYAKGNHSVRSKRYRYTRYQDGSAELYDHHNDPNEWHNLAGDTEYDAIVESLRHLLPTAEAPYHKATRPGAVNRWFDEHLKANGIH